MNQYKEILMSNYTLIDIKQTLDIYPFTKGQIQHYQAYQESYQEAHASPGPFTCPNTGNSIEPTISVVMQEPPQPWIVYHVVDCADGAFWSYKRSEGWRLAPEEILKRVKR